MVLAYLRGVLKPGYPMGIRSHIREDVILEAVSREVGSQSLQDVLMTSLLARPGMSHEVLHNLKSLTKRIGIVRELKSLEPVTPRVDGLIAIYNALQKSNLLKSLKCE